MSLPLTRCTCQPNASKRAASGSKPVTSEAGPSACWLLTSTMPIRLSSFQWLADQAPFPDRALAELAVGEQAIDEGLRLLALQPEAEPTARPRPCPSDPPVISMPGV